MAVGLIVGALGQPILKLFDISDQMMPNAYRCLLIESSMIPIFSLQIGAMSIFMAIGDIVRSNVSAIFQDTITYFPTLGLMVLITNATHNI
jgi:Na+-driven multidrug efflux pump